MDITPCMHGDNECTADYVCLCIMSLVFCLPCHCSSVPRSHVGTAEKSLPQHPGWLDYSVRDSGASMTWRVSPVRCLTAVCRCGSVCGALAVFLFRPLSFWGMWWGAVIYKKWLGGNSSNMICVGAHKTSPSVTLKEWNGRAVLIGLPLSHCRDRKCVQKSTRGTRFFWEFLSQLMTTISFYH